MKVFPEVVDELVARYRALAAEDQDLTVVFDAGQNSAGNFATSPTPGWSSSARYRPRTTWTCSPSRTAARRIDAGRFPG